MRKTILLGAALLGLAACAGLTLGALLGRLSVTMDREIPFPGTVTLQGPPAAGGLGGSVLAGLGDNLVERQLGGLLQGQTADLRRQAAALLRGQVESAGIFSKVLDQGGDLGLSVGVSRYGLAFSDGRWQLVLDLEMKLSEPRLGVVWSGRRSAADLSADLKQVAGHVSASHVLAEPGSLDRLATAAFKDLASQLLDDMRRQQATGAMAFLQPH